MFFSDTSFTTTPATRAPTVSSRSRACCGDSARRVVRPQDQHRHIAEGGEDLRIRRDAQGRRVHEDAVVRLRVTDSSRFAKAELLRSSEGLSTACLLARMSSPGDHVVADGLLQGGRSDQDLEQTLVVPIHRKRPVLHGPAQIGVQDERLLSGLRHGDAEIRHERGLALERQRETSPGRSGPLRAGRRRTGPCE